MAMLRNSTAAAEPKVIVALDFADATRALSLVARLDPKACALKVGNELFVSAGPEPVRELVTTVSETGIWPGGISGLTVPKA